MKKIILSILVSIFLSTMIINAQDKSSGTVVYEEVTKIEIKLEGEMAHLMKDMPKEQRAKKMLYFSPEASLYTATEKDDKMDEAMGGGGMAHAMGGGGMTIMMGAPDNKLYVDLKKEEVIEQREFMTRTFLINGEMPSSDWKITGEQKMLLDYPCMEATKTDTAGVVTRVWFAPTIPVKCGPGSYCNLPGLVLEVDIEDGKRKMLAKSIDFTMPAKEFFKKPKDGKKVSNEEFDKIVAEKIKEMGGEGGTGSGSTIMIRVKH